MPKGYLVLQSSFRWRKEIHYPIIPEEDLKVACLAALSQIIDRKDECIADCQTRIENDNGVFELRKNCENAKEALLAQI